MLWISKFSQHFLGQSSGPLFTALSQNAHLPPPCPTPLACTSSTHFTQALSRKTGLGQNQICKHFFFAMKHSTYCRHMAAPCFHFKLNVFDLENEEYFFILFFFFISNYCLFWSWLIIPKYKKTEQNLLLSQICFCKMKKLKTGLMEAKLVISFFKPIKYLGDTD